MTKRHARPSISLVAILTLAACGGATPAPAGSPSSQGPPQTAAAPEPQYDEYGNPIPSSTPAPVGAAPQPQPVAQAKPQPPPEASPPPPVGPVRERAHQLREAADLLDKAEAARDREAKSFAEQLFSSAELIVGVEALADLAPRFREGAPPRVTEPPKPAPANAAPQPIAEGDSDKDRPEPPKPTRGEVAGAVQMDGRALAGELAVVTLEPLGKKKGGTIPTARVIEQRNRQFAPRVLVVPVGSLVSFPNFDPTFHNVFSTSTTKPFDLGLYKTNQTREILFDKEGTVRLACNLHANMSAFIVVMSAPHYTITDGSGRFKFKSVAPGKYLARVYSDRAMKPVEREVEIKAGKNELALGVTADAPSGPLPDKFGVARGSKTP